MDSREEAPRSLFTFTFVKNVYLRIEEPLARGFYISLLTATQLVYPNFRYADFIVLSQTPCIISERENLIRAHYRIETIKIVTGNHYNLHERKRNKNMRFTADRVVATVELTSHRAAFRRSYFWPSSRSFSRESLIHGT